MKLLSILSVVFITLISCNCQKKVVDKTATSATESKASQANMEFIYTANTRGFYQKITIRNQEVFVSSDRNATDNGEKIVISNVDWTELLNYSSKLKLEDLSTYKDPTQKRFYDGAAIADLKVVYEGKEYQSKSFDNGFPPLEIEKLVNKITSFGVTK